MAADGDPQEDAAGSDLSDSSGASSSSPSPAPTPPAPPPHPLPVAVMGPPTSSSATAAAPLHLHPHVYFQHQQRLLSLQLSAASTPTSGTQQRAPTSTPLPISTEPPPAQPSERPFRDDCWSENATLTLIQAWGDRYLDLNRGNLKQKHWKDVAHSVNARPLTSSKPPKTDVQCKNRLDTLKKKYKIEKSKLVTGGAPSKWAFFDRLDELIGSSKKLKTSSSGKAPRAVASVADGNCTSNPNGQCTGTGISAAKCMEEDVKQPIFFLPPQAAAPLPVPHLVNTGSVHMNHGAIHTFNHLAGVPIFHHLSEGAHMNHHGGTPANHLTSGIASVVGGATAAPAPADTGSKSKAGPDMSQSSPLENRPIDSKRSKRKRDRHRSGEENPFRDLARAIFKFGEVYERVEIAKLQQMMEIEKQRMEFTKDLEIQRLQLFMQTQVELAKMKYGSSKHSNAGAEHHG